MIIRFILTSIISALFSGVVMAQEATTPSFLIFMADDLGWNDVGYHGSDIRTPNIDALAANAVRLEQFYTMPWCSATRAAFETGLNPARFGMRSLQHNFPNRTALPPGLPTLPELLGRSDYFTALIGKWHLSYDFNGGPLDRGYRSAFGYLHGQMHHYSHDDQFGISSLFRNADLIQADGHMTDLIFSELKSVLSNQSAPFFINVTFSAPHYPLLAPDEFIAMNSAIEHPDRRVYAAMVSHMDAVIGKAVEFLRTHGKLEDTIIVFLSDNGGHPVSAFPATYYDGQHGPYEVMADNHPFRGGKTDVYEGGIRVPAFIHYPRILKPGSFHGFATVVDLLPTIIDFAGGEPPVRDGVSLLDELGSGSDERDIEFFWFSRSVNMPYGARDQDSLRLGKWKLIETQRRFRWLPWRFKWPWPKIELFDLNIDPGETTDLSDVEQHVTSKLRRKLQNYREQQFGQLLAEFGAGQ